MKTVCAKHEVAHDVDEHCPYCEEPGIDEVKRRWGEAMNIPPDILFCRCALPSSIPEEGDTFDAGEALIQLKREHKAKWQVDESAIIRGVEIKVIY